MMDKKIAVFLGVLVCVTFFSADLPNAEAGLHASTRERYAEQNRRKEELESITTLVQGTSKDAQVLTPIVLDLQKRIARYNGLKITAEPLKGENGYKDTIHPEVVVDNYRNACSTGSGHLYFGVESMKSDVESRDFHSMDQFDYMSLEKTIAHEIGHSIRGDDFYTLLAWKTDSRREQDAEDEAVELTDTLPEGGWGVYTMSVSRCANRPKQIVKNLRKMEEKAKGRVLLNSGKRKYNGIIDYPAEACDDSVYVAANGKSYQIVAGIDAKTMRNPAYNVDPTYHNDDAYLAGQIAECIAKDAFRPENIFVAQNHLRNEVGFEGDYLLICKSAALPNGYRVLATLYGPEARLTHMIDLLHHGQFKALDEFYVACTDNMKKARKRSIGRSEWLIGEVGGMAVDNAAH